MTIRKLLLLEYISLTAHLPRPTARQKEEFPQFVSQAHSWYKHLPILSPWARFHFFLDPSAGMERGIASDGSVRVLEREKSGFHYSWIPTQEYRRRFGHLAFSTLAGSSVSLIDTEDEVHVPSDDAPVIYDFERAELSRLPEPVLEAGTAWISGIVHPLAAQPGMWSRLLREKYPPEWPEESGGMNGLQKILDRCRSLTEDSSLWKRLRSEDAIECGNVDLHWVDLPLHELLEPERRRQLGSMVDAMNRVMEVVGSHAISDEAASDSRG